VKQLDPDFDTEAYEKLFLEYLREDEITDEEDLKRRINAYCNNLDDFKNAIRNRYVVWNKVDRWSLTKQKMDWFTKDTDIIALVAKYPKLLPIMNYIDRASDKDKNDTDKKNHAYDEDNRRYAIFRTNNIWYAKAAKDFKAKDLNFSVGTIKKYMQALKQVGFIKYLFDDGRGGQLRTTVYADGHFVKGYYNNKNQLRKVPFLTKTKTLKQFKQFKLRH
jgi:hypothetical protein